jgi:hypothetical protein
MSAEKKQKRVQKCTADAVQKKMHCICSASRHGGIRGCCTNSEICADFLALQMQCTFFSTAFFERKKKLTFDPFLFFLVLYIRSSGA